MPSFTVTEVSSNVRDWTAQGRYAMREYRVHLMPADSATPLLNVEWSRRAESPAPVVDQRVEGDVEDRGPHGLKFRQAQNPMGGSGGGGGGSKEAFKADPAKQAGINMSSAQKTAVEILRLAAERGEYKPPSAADVAGQVRTIADVLYEQIHGAVEAES